MEPHPLPQCQPDPLPIFPDLSPAVVQAVLSLLFSNHLLLLPFNSLALSFFKSSTLFITTWEDSVVGTVSASSALRGWRERILFREREETAPYWARLGSLPAPSSTWSSQYLCARDISVPLQSWGNSTLVRLKDLPNHTNLVSHRSVGFQDIHKGHPYWVPGLWRISCPVLKGFPLRSGLRLLSSRLPSFGLLHQCVLHPVWGQVGLKALVLLSTLNKPQVRPLGPGAPPPHQPHPHTPASSVRTAPRNSLSSQLPL